MYSNIYAYIHLYSYTYMYLYIYSKRVRAFRWALGKVYRWVASYCRFLLRSSTTSTKIEQKWDPTRPQMVPIRPRGGGARGTRKSTEI